MVEKGEGEQDQSLEGLFYSLHAQNCLLALVVSYQLEKFQIPVDWCVEMQSVPGSMG